MKKVFLIYIALIIGVSQGFASLLFISLPPKKSDSLAMDEPVKSEQIVEISARTIKNNNYFKLLMKNEDKSSAYSLVRVYENGEFESVGIRFGHVNTIDQPIWYSFVDREVPNKDFTYTLLRISEETVVMKKWTYCKDSKEICEVPYELLANE